MQLGLHKTGTYLYVRRKIRPNHTYVVKYHGNDKRNTYMQMYVCNEQMNDIYKYKLISVDNLRSFGVHTL
jgi:hypothetical protein